MPESDIALSTQVLVFGGMFMGFGIKVPIFPFHTWLPDAHTQAPTVGSVILAAILLKLGTYGFIRVALPILPDAAIEWAPFIGALAVIGIIYGALACLAQTDMKRLIAFSSVAHMGFVMLGIATLTDFGLNAALFGMVAHGLITGMLFFVAGSVKERYHTLEIRQLGGLLVQAPRMGWILGFCAMASLGLPSLAGFWGEFPAILAAYDPAEGLSTGLFRTYMVVAAVGTVFAAGYLLWLYQRTAFGTPKPEFAHHHIHDVGPVRVVGLDAVADPDRRARVRARADLRRHRRGRHPGRPGLQRRRLTGVRARLAARPGRAGGPGRPGALRSPGRRLARPGPRDRDRRRRGRRDPGRRHQVGGGPSLHGGPHRPRLPGRLRTVGHAGRRRDTRELFGGAYVVDRTSLLLKALFLLSGYVIVLLSSNFIAEGDYWESEYYLMLLSAVIGMVVMCSAGDFVTIFVALELLSLPAYLLATWNKRDGKSNEAGLKYYLMGVFASALMLYGMSLVFGVAGTTILVTSPPSSAQPESSTPVITLGIVFVIIGFGFKVSAVPFHTWAPDTYEGAPTPVTAFLAVASKSAGFVALLQLIRSASSSAPTSSSR